MKQNSVSLAKITPPTLSGVLPRERLFNLLDRGRDRPVIWITGPPGSGKTSLVSSYLADRKLHSLWYRIDESDADAATFFYYMNLAAKNVLQSKKSTLPLLTPEYQKDISAFTHRYFEGFYSQVKKTPFIVVFDNYQKVQEKAMFHRVINAGLSKIPKGVNVILISRCGMPSILARMRANYLPEIIAWNELRFTLEEAEGVIRMRGYREQSGETIQNLHNRTNGWIAGLVLMLERAKIENIGDRSLDKLTPEEIFDYFATEIFEKTDSEVQEFLVKTALFPRMTVRMAESLTGCRRANRILADLNRSNYFIEKYQRDEPVYQYQPLFREFLVSRARSLFTGTDFSEFQQDAASILIEFNLIDDAAGILSETCNWEKLLQLIHKHAQSLIAQGRSQTLERWLASLPDDIFKNKPWLFYWKGLCRLPFSPDESRRYFEEAFQLFRGQQDLTGICLAWSGVVESVFYDFELTRLDRWISVLEDLMNNFAGFPSEEIEARVASCMLTALVLRQPHHPDIESWAERALSLSEGREDISIKIQTLFNLSWHKMFSGDFAGAALVINSLREATQSGTVTTLDLLKLKAMEAFYYWLTAAHDQCRRAVSEGLELARETGVHVMDYLLLGHGTANALSSGDLPDSRKLLQRMGSSTGSLRPWNKSFYHFLVSWEALLEHDLKKALLHAEVALKLSFEAGVAQTEAVCHVEKACVMHELKEHSCAEEQLKLACGIGEKVKSRLIEFMCLLSESQCRFDMGDEKAGLASLQRAMSIGRKQGYVNTFMWRSPAVARLCEKALETGIEVEYVQNLIKSRGLASDAPPLHIENWPWLFRIFTLGRFGLVKDGKPVRFSGKVQKKPLSMLKALVTFGGREVAESQLMDALWYDADGDVAHRSFATTLHRLRKLIGNEKVIRLREGRVTLDPRYCWVDVWAFERILGQIDVAWKEGLTGNDMTRTISLAERAIEMYKGPFMAGETDQPWVVSCRERLRSKFLRNVGKIGLYWEHAGDLNKAANCYKKGLEVDDLAEEFHQRLMICYQRLGRRAEALAAYNRCKNTLLAVLGVQPSVETEAIYKSILSE